MINKLTPRKNIKIAGLGAGSFGTAMAYIASHNDYSVYLYCRDEAQKNQINRFHKNPKRLSEFILPNNIVASTDIIETVSNATIIIHTIPAQHTPSFVSKIYHLLPKNTPYVSTSKGIHAESHMLMSDAICKAMNGRATLTETAVGLQRPEIPLAFMSGPSFAKELMQKHPISVVIASDDRWCAIMVQRLLSSQYLRLYTTDDVTGVEIGGA